MHGSPEGSALLLLAGGTAPDAAVAQALARVGDWPYLLLAAAREQATGVLHEACQRHADVVPEEVRQRLRRQERVTRFLMTYLEQRVQQSCDALRQAGIPVVLLKGGAMASSFYPSFAERPMVDVDLLIHPADAARAVDVLLANGWLWRADKPRDGDFSHLHHLPELRDAKGVEISLELHTALFPPGHPFAITTDDIVRQASAVAREGKRLLIPHINHLLIHAATHFTWSHLLRSGGWRTFRDVAHILRSGTVEWHSFEVEARRTRSVTSCYWTLFMARELAGAPVPDEILARLAPPIPRWLRHRLLAFYAGLIFPPRTDLPPIRIRRLMWTLGMLPGWSGHGASRPWEVLALAPGDAARRTPPGTPGRVARWMAYARDLLPVSLAVKSPAAVDEEL